jgi:hypothetical protein
MFTNSKRIRYFQISKDLRFHFLSKLLNFLIVKMNKLFNRNSSFLLRQNQVVGLCLNIGFGNFELNHFLCIIVLLFGVNHGLVKNLFHPCLHINKGTKGR